jgi:hypothetical protein
MTSAVLAVVVRPWLWSSALRLAPRGWWRRRPFLPMPDRDYLRFRLVTQYGDPEHVPDPDDVVAWLQWCRMVRRHGL